MARDVGTWIGQHGGQLVYGGGHSGLMGIMADAALAAGARVVGVIPTALVEKEWAHTGFDPHRQRRTFADARTGASGGQQGTHAAD